MRKINEILRLRAQGMSVADIATSTGAGRTTVYEYLARAESAGVGWPLPDEVDEETPRGQKNPANSPGFPCARSSVRV
jgi:transposase